MVSEIYQLTDGYRLVLMTSERDALQHGRNSHKARVSYRLLAPGTETIFEGDDFQPSLLHSALGREAACGLVSFLTLQPGDTDEEYFINYSPEQLEWAIANGERYSSEWEELLGGCD